MQLVTTLELKDNKSSSVYPLFCRDTSHVHVDIGTTHRHVTIFWKKRTILMSCACIYHDSFVIKTPAPRFCLRLWNWIFFRILQMVCILHKLCPGCYTQKNATRQLSVLQIWDGRNCLVDSPEMHGVRTPSPITIEVARIVTRKSMTFALVLFSSFPLIQLALFIRFDGVSNL